ncbi:helix-turn-helix domain-containing protein [Paracoccus aminophilus]|uniref:HTH DNA binding domain-containing protein n=1 Tax=Paracoccus aminophilus JCM 7686 TaxID=1367847 RepID=S5YIX0_PARAH|nr:helix-turn-helix domain-containing protein [Paracoccus aminophilus]AGT11418.1 hypothetical protein JCM7686_pAMI6p088 [Paracoccus aminophilus JCM 7686]
MSFPTDAPPIPAPSDRRASDLTDPEVWLRAEARLAQPLARAACALGALDAAIEEAPWLAQRLALIEVESMLWGQGVILRREDIGRELLAARSGADTEGLTQARWALRRLLPAHGSNDPARRTRDLRSFLGLHRVEIGGLSDALTQRPCGADFDESARLFQHDLTGFAKCHPLTRAAAALMLWRRAGLSPVEDVIESATFTAIVMVEDLASLGFAPLGAHGRQVWRSSAAPEARLQLWLTAVLEGATDARAELRRFRNWRAAALRSVAAMKGGTPARLVEFALQRPLISTEDAELALGISRDSAERGLTRLQAAGLLREVTGRGRFRLWTTAC